MDFTGIAFGGCIASPPAASDPESEPSALDELLGF